MNEQDQSHPSVYFHHNRVTMILSGIVPNSVSAQGGDDGRRRVNPQQGGDGFRRQSNPQSGRALAAAKALGTTVRPQDPARALVNCFAPEFEIKDPGANRRKEVSDRQHGTK